jgi:phosphatidylinositol alpha-1,6-mannosyltransferase
MPPVLRTGDGLIGLFAGCVALGGVQASGRIAWDAIARAAREHPAEGFGEPYRLCYGDTAPPGGRHELELHTSSKRAAVLAAVALRRRSPLVLVWQVALLKLLPFLRVRGATIVLFLHGTEVWGRQNWAMHALLRRVNLFLSNTDYTWQRFAQATPSFARASHLTVALGIGMPFGGPTPVPRASPVALLLGRLLRREDYKGHRELLEAWPIVLQRHPEAELWIAGDGDLRPELERLAGERRLGSAVRFWGRVTEEQKQELIAQARCVALPSRGEGFGLVYLEGMRLGRPCLVSSCDAGREVVDPPRCGLSVNPADRPALAAALARLLVDSSEWQHWSRSARERYERYFTADAFQQRLVTALARAVSPGYARTVDPSLSSSSARRTARHPTA